MELSAQHGWEHKDYRRRDYWKCLHGGVGGGETMSEAGQ